MRFWYDDERTGSYPVVRTLERLAQAPLGRLHRPMRVTAEWQRPQAGHPSTYALLGASFAPDAYCRAHLPDDTASTASSGQVLLTANCSLPA